MTKQDIENTLDKLYYQLKLQELKKDDRDEIRVRMGRRLATQIICNLDSVIYCNVDEINTIMGYPLELEYNNDMCIEIHIVKKLPIYKDNEPIY